MWIICYSKLFVLLKLLSPGVPLDVEIMQLGSFVYNKMFVIVIIAIKETWPTHFTCSCFDVMVKLDCRMKSSVITLPSCCFSLQLFRDSFSIRIMLLFI